MLLLRWFSGLLWLWSNISSLCLWWVRLTTSEFLCHVHLLLIQSTCHDGHEGSFTETIRGGTGSKPDGSAGLLQWL